MKSLIVGLFVLLLVVTGCTHKEKKANDDIKPVDTPQETTTEDVVDESKSAALIVQEGDHKVLISERFGFKLPFPMQWKESLDTTIRNGVLAELDYANHSIEFQISVYKNENNRTLEQMAKEVNKNEVVEIGGRRAFVESNYIGFNYSDIIQRLYSIDYKNYFLDFNCSSQIVENNNQPLQELGDLCDKVVKEIQWSQE